MCFLAKNLTNFESLWYKQKFVSERSTMSHKISDIEEKTGLPKRLIRFYHDSQVVIPDEPRPKGRGYHVTYSDKNLREWKLVTALALFRLPVSGIKIIMDTIRDSGAMKGVLTDSEEELKLQDRYLLIRGKPEEGKLQLQAKIVGGGEGKTGVVVVEDLKEHPIILSLDLVAILLG
jgi:DNA-binding transcriptional MerR regulator